MYTASNVIYHEQTSACTSTTIDPTGRCVTCYERTNFSISYSRNSANVVNLGRVRVQQSVAADSEEPPEESVREQAPKRWPGIYRPSMRVVDKPWRASRRITQQRPRDGLR